MREIDFSWCGDHRPRAKFVGEEYQRRTENTNKARERWKRQVVRPDGNDNGRLYMGGDVVSFTGIYPLDLLLEASTH